MISNLSTETSMNYRIALRSCVALFLAATIFLPTNVPAQSSTCAEAVTVRAGDTLSALAREHLGSYAAYTEIVKATEQQAANDSSFATIDDPNILEIGWKLCILDAAPSSPAATTPDAVVATISPTLTPIPATVDDDFDVDLEALQIENMRARTYPGSKIVVEQMLETGVNYNRYVVSYRSEGNKIYAMLTVPFGEAPAAGWPVIIFNHGYIPPTIYRTTERYVAYVDGFARNGYIVFRSDYRGHGFSEGKAGGAYGSPNYTIDVLNAVASVKTFEGADPERIGMWGHSMGGHITLRSMVVTDDIKVGVIWAGVVGTYEDIVFNWHRDGRFPVPASISQRARRWREQLLEEVGEPDKNPQFWASISPNSYVAEISGPIQLHHGTADADVPWDFSTVLYDQLVAADQVAENYIYAGDNHNLSVGFNSAMDRSVAFFDKYLK